MTTVPRVMTSLSKAKNAAVAVADVAAVVAADPPTGTTDAQTAHPTVSALPQMAPAAMAHARRTTDLAIRIAATTGVMDVTGDAISARATTSAPRATPLLPHPRRLHPRPPRPSPARCTAR